MSDKKLENNYRKVDTEKAPAIFSEPNNLSEILKDLKDYEDWGFTDILFQNPDGGVPLVKKHDPYENVDKAKKVKKKAAKTKENKQSEVKDVSSIENELKEIMKILKDSTAYEEYLGVAGGEESKVNTDEFPMSDEI